jgi:hypothetical protein
MKYFFLLFFLNNQLGADVHNLGLIDSRNQMLDQRYTQEFDAQDEQQALGQYYLSKEEDLLKSLQQGSSINEITIDQQWKDLLGVNLK